MTTDPSAWAPEDRKFTSVAYERILRDVHGIDRYRPVGGGGTVRAVQWTGTDNCEVVFAFIGLEHSDDEMDHSEIHLPDPASGEKSSTAVWHDWFVRHPDGVIEIMSDKAFRARYVRDGG